MAGRNFTKEKSMKLKTIWLKTKVTFRSDDEAPEDDLHDFVEDIASELRIDQTRYSANGTVINAKSDITNVIR